MFFIFAPKIGEMIHFDDHISQMGWSWNHQLGNNTLPETNSKSGWLEY